jgi:hypothetical protein
MDLSIRARAFAIESEARQAADPATAVNLLAVRCAQLEAAARSEKERADRWHARSIELGDELEQVRAGQGFTYDGSFEPVNTLATPDGPVG